MDIVTLALAKKGAKSYTDTKLGAITGDFNYLGSVATMEDLPSSANVGDEYTVGNQGPYVYNGTEWVAASIQGPQGEIGPEGPQGKPGKDGKDGGEINAYKEIKKIKDYLYETYYDECDYEYAKEYFNNRKVNLSGACSAVRKGNFYGRNFDWVYDEGAEFIVRTPRIGNRYASMGVVGHVEGLTNEFVESGEFSKAYKILPFDIVDGINEHGLVVNSNVVPNDKGINIESVPAIETRDRICNLMLVRYILDNFKTAQEAVEYIRDYVAIYPIKTLEDMNYELHFMIADEKKTYVLEIVDNVVRVIDVTEKPMMTNFYLYGVTFNADGKTYYPAINDETHNAKITNGVTDHGCGLERYAKMVDAYSGLNSLSSMMEFMNHGLRYTKAYTGGDAEGIGEWCTEFVDGDLTVESSLADFGASIAAAQYAYQHRTRNPEEEYFGTWQSTHSVVYDIKNREMNIVVQEDNDRLKYNYNELLASSFDIPRLVVIPSMVIGQNPVKIQCNAEMNAIMTDIEIPFVILDASAVGLGSSTFNKAKMRTTNHWLLTQTAGNYETETEKLMEGSLQSVVYNSSTMIGTYEETILLKDTDIVDSLNSISTERPLSANMGHELNTNKQDKEDNNLVTRDKNVVRAINETNSIAKGANQAKGFRNYETLIIELNAAAADAFKAGQNFYIQTLNVPDIWIMSVEATNVPYTYTTDEAFIAATEAEGGCQVGYYKLAQLETQKVDLTNYVKDTDYATQTDAGVIKASSSYGFGMTNGNLFASEKTYAQYQSGNNNQAISKGTLENVIAGKELENKVTDVQVGSASVLENGVAKVTVSTSYGTSSYGAGHVIGLSKATNEEINAKASNYKPIVASNLDYAIEKGLGANTLTWTSAEKLSAQTTIGLATEEWTFTLSDNTTVTKNVKVSN